MTRLHEETRRLPGPPDQAEELDQGQVQAHLHARGQQVARDMDLGHVSADDLVALGRLDIIGRHPALPPDLAISLEVIATARDHNPFPTWQEWTARHQGHRHAANETCSEPASARGATPDSARASQHGLDSGLDQGQVDHQRREVLETPEKFDPIKKYLRKVRDPPDEYWS
jgi:hypothetical protein